MAWTPGASPSTQPPASVEPPASGEPVSGVTWVVANGGSDHAAGTEAAPFRTVARALNHALAGDTVLVRPGTYRGFDVAVAGRADAPITVLGDPGGGVIIDGRLDGRLDTIHVLPASAYLVLDGLTVTGSSGSRSAGILVDGVTSGPVSIVRSRLTDNDGYGILISDSRDVTISDSEVDHDQTGVEVNGDGAGVVIRDDRIHDNDRLIRATPRRVDPHDDYGASGVSLVRTIGPVLVERNQVWRNRAPSSDYGWDGSAFEIFGASGVTIRDNTAWDNENVLETGTANGTPCADDVFARNVAWGAASAGRARGIILRCGERMLLASDTLVDLDDYALMVGSDSRLFSGSIDGARVVDMLMVTADAAAPLVVTSALPADLVIEHTLLWNDRGPIGRVDGTGETSDLARLQRWTGQLASSVNAPPRFVDRRAHDYRLSAGSPAIDAGVAVPGVTDVGAGSAPDLGAIETP
jgi:hypothetical protein